MTLHRRTRLLLFGILALLANLAIALLLRHDRRAIVAAASGVDFVVSLPALYYFLVIRAGAQPLVTLVPVLAAGMLRAAYLAPFNGFSRIVLGGMCECGVAWFLLRQGRNSLVARVLLSELSVLRYALAGWWMQPDVPLDGHAFSMHKSGGASAMFGLFATIGVVEAALTHFIVQRWSATAAWLIFGLSIYGAILLIALARSFSLRPIVVTERSVLIRSGMIWSVEIEPRNIARVHLSSATPAECLRVTGMAEPNVLVELRHCVTAEGLYGRRRTVSSIGISADQPHELMQAILKTK
jgi:hypothetical protein